MSKEIKEFFDGIKLAEGEEFNHDTIEELSNNRGDDEEGGEKE